MGPYLLRRLLGCILLLVGVSIIVFLILQAIPGGPLAVYLRHLERSYACVAARRISA